MNELEIIRHRRIDGLSVFFDTVDYRTPHIHPEWELIWVLENPLRVVFGQERAVVEAGEVVLFNPNEPHELHKEYASSTFLCFQISSSILPALPSVHVDGKIVGAYIDQAELNAIKAALSDIAKAYFGKDEFSSLRCIGQSCLVLHTLLSRLPSHVLTAEETSSIDKRNARLRRLISFVDENYMHKIRLSDFAEAEGCSVSYLSRFIKNTLNQNFQEYVTSVRFNCACKLICADNMRLLDVCMESGFSDYRYFSREFKKQYGMTPEEYSRHADRSHLESSTVRQSIHSMERFYSAEESLKLAERYLR